MNIAAPAGGAPSTGSAWSGWGVLLIAALAIVVPTIVDLQVQFWSNDQNTQGPIVIAMAAWLLYRKGRDAIQEVGVAAPSRAARTVASVVLGVSLLAYAVGRSQAMPVLSVMALTPIVACVSVLLFGTAFTKRIWFAIFFLLFTVPLPGSVTDVLTAPMKVAVSWASEHLLHALDYPIARAGVVLYMGQFQLLVADACAGLHSLFTLEALGLLYLNVVRHESVMRNVLLGILIVPVSFASNTLRVVTLALITFHYGDAAGQGFLHEFSGMVLFLSALMFIIMLDGGLRSLDRWLGSLGSKKGAAS